MTQSVTYSPSIRPRLIRIGIPVLILLVGITIYILLNAETFERNSDPDSIGIPVFLVLIWVSVSTLALLPTLLIGGTQLVVAPHGFAFGGRLKGAYLQVEGTWRDVLVAGYQEVYLRTSGIYLNRALFGLQVRQPDGEQFISLHHYRDQLRAGERLAQHLKQVAPSVYAAIEESLTTRRPVQVVAASADGVGEGDAGYWMMRASQANRAGDHRAEAEAYRRAAAITPQEHTLYFYWANALMQSGQPEAAIAVMQQGLQARPTSSAMAFNIAKTARSLGKGEQARTYFERALALAAQDPELADRDDFIRQVHKEMTSG
jgi:hypothetical protein